MKKFLVFVILPIVIVIYAFVSIVYIPELFAQVPDTISYDGALVISSDAR